MRGLLFLFLALFISDAGAITLKEAVDTALSKNNELRAKLYEVEEKGKDLTISKLHLLPTVDLYGKYNRTTDPPYSIMNRMETKELNMYATNFNEPGVSDLYTTGITAKFPIWMAGKIRIGIDLARNELKATREQLEKTRDRVILDVISAYYNVLTAKAFVKTAEFAYFDAKKHVKDAKAVYESGLGVKSDYLRAKVYLEQAEENLVRAKSNLEIAKRALNVAMGVPPSNEVEVEGDLTYKPYQFNLSEAVKVALSTRRELKELKYRLKQTEDLKKLAISEFLPSISAFYDYHIDSDEKLFGRENSSWTMGIQANLNLFDGGVKFVKLRKAKLTRLKVKEYIERAKKGIEFEVSRAFFKVEEAKKRVELAQASLEEAQESLRIVDKRYRNGLASITELLDTQTALNAARTNYVKALSDYRISLIKLLYAQGVLSKRYEELSR